ncbi:hypothetical protein JAAARDRAFT_118062 [Jaapia argillacea MUCL 33604]|uniref:tRNA (guanine(9)-N1)-methyltransferase n=1 Tax=Jaapia argillacea MUCL 33604 TaxID=933084 RepID=A0A067QKT6_9AGAM|nr:hypothetical protein JAAARDRAFT_118062 [Jaapia argillacea MUCL 33604]
MDLPPTVEPPPEPNPGPSSTETPNPSKSALKKQAKAARLNALKLERRAREKEAKKEKKRVRAEKRAAGDLDSDEERREEEKRRLKKKQKKGNVGEPFGARVVVDLGFDELMSEKEVASLCSQLAYTYSANRRSARPFSLLFTSLNGRTLSRLEGINNSSYKRWNDTEWWQDDYDKLWEPRDDQGTVAPQVNVEGEVTTEVTSPPIIQRIAVAPQDTVVYLTADSSEELTELKEGETYIIGGICDHNRYKNLCLNKANKSAIRTARLPIGTYLSHLPTRKVLTVNQVFEIMLKWAETRDWEQALYAVIPKRKFQGKDQKSSKGEDEGVDEQGLAEDGLEEDVEETEKGAFDDADLHTEEANNDRVSSPTSHRSIVPSIATFQ